MDLKEYQRLAALTVSTTLNEVNAVARRLGVLNLESQVVLDDRPNSVRSPRRSSDPCSMPRNWT